MYGHYMNHSINCTKECASELDGFLGKPSNALQNEAKPKVAVFFLKMVLSGEPE